MNKIIEFPNKNERLITHIQKVIDKLNITEPNVKECIKNRVTETLSKHKGIPTFNFNINLAISESDSKKLNTILSEEYNKIVVPFSLKLIDEICMLQAQLCKCEYSK